MTCLSWRTETHLRICRRWQRGGHATIAGVARVDGRQRRGSVLLSLVVLRVGLVVGEGLGELPVAALELVAVAGGAGAEAVEFGEAIGLEQPRLWQGRPAAGGSRAAAGGGSPPGGGG